MTERSYTTTEVAKIAGVTRERVKSSIARRSIIPSDIHASSGRYGYTYLFDKCAVEKYCELLGVLPEWDKADTPAVPIKPKNVFTPAVTIEHVQGYAVKVGKVWVTEGFTLVNQPSYMEVSKAKEIADITGGSAVAIIWREV